MGRAADFENGGRRDICSVLLTSREVYKEASKLVHERLNLTVDIVGDRGAAGCMYHLRRIGCSGPWNRFRKIKTFLRPLDQIWFTQRVPNVIDDLKEVWKLLRSHLRAKDKGCWMRFLVYHTGTGGLFARYRIGGIRSFRSISGISSN
jgi:hypothetical protein